MYLSTIIFRKEQCSSECVLILDHIHHMRNSSVHPCVLIWDHIQNSSFHTSVYLSMIIIRTAVFIPVCPYLGSYSEQHSVHPCVLIWDHIQNSSFHPSVLIPDHNQNSTVFILVCPYLGSYSEQHCVHLSVCLSRVIF